MSKQSTDSRFEYSPFIGYGDIDRRNLSAQCNTVLSRRYKFCFLVVPLLVVMVGFVAYVGPSMTALLISLI